MSEWQSAVLVWAWAVLGLVWLALMVLVAWICAQWRKERGHMRAKAKELEAWVGDVMANPQCYKSGAMKLPQRELPPADPRYR